MILKISNYSILCYFFLTLICINNCIAQNPSKKIPFTEAASLLEQKFEVKFSFNSKTAARIHVDTPNISNSLSEILEGYIKQDDITFTIIGKRYITVQFPKKFISFCATFIETQSGKPINAILTGNNKTFVVPKSGVLTIEKISDDEVLQLYVNDLYVRDIVIYEFLNKPTNCPFVFINSNYVNKLPTVTLKSYITKGIDKTNKGAITIQNKDFEILPSLIEPDVLQIAQVIPGIESYDETASNINIRGGASDEVNILWNDIRMYQTGHFFGLISAFNPNLIENVLIYKNGTHPRYSEGVSGVLHMYPTNTISPEIDGGVGINLSSANAFVKIPISNTFALHASGRTSINNGIGNPIYKSFFERTFQNTEITNLNTNATEAVRTTDEDFNFYDISISALWDISPKDHINYHFMTINNALQFTERLFIDDISTATFNEVKQNTLLGGFNYQRDWNSKLSTALHYSASTYTASANKRQIEIITEAFQTNEVKEQTLKFDASYRINDQFSLEAGYQFTDTSIENSQVLPSSSIPTTNNSNLITNGFYLQGIAGFFDDKTLVTLGSRVTSLSTFDTQIEPRITISHKIKKNWNTFLAAEKKHQSILQFTANENQILAIENKQWFIADGNNNPLVKSTQVSLGTDFSKNKWTLSGEGFYKKVDGINTQNLGFRNQLQNTQAIGNYKAYGLELSVGKQIDNLSTWLSYSYTNSSYQFESLSPQEFPANFNVAHALNGIATYTLKNFTFSIGANYHSGLPFTTPISDTAITTDGTLQIQYNTPNNANLKPYFRTNVSGVYEAKLDSTFSARINVALLNIFDTKNELASYFQVEKNPEGTATINRIDQFSLGFTPNVSLQLLF